jgi:hypothetical protein
MTIHITKSKAAVALVVVALLVPVTAIATHTFSDVPDGRYYTDAVEWAAENEITTGTSATTFSPEDAVTRGQNVTFAYRYDQNIVQPALTELESLFPIARSAGSTDDVDEDEPRTHLLSVEIEAPVPGIIQLNGFVRVDTGAFSELLPGTVLCYFDLSGIDVPDELLLEGEIYYAAKRRREVTCPVTACADRRGWHAHHPDGRRGARDGVLRRVPDERPLRALGLERFRRRGTRHSQ